VIGALGASACGGSVAPTEPPPVPFYGPAVVEDSGVGVSVRDAAAVDAAAVDATAVDAADSNNVTPVFYGPAPVSVSDASEDQETDAPAAEDATPHD
jgi:hypothetical protein